MNIIVAGCNGRTSFRPDSTWLHEDKDIFAPDFVQAYNFVPVLYVRISQAGVGIPEKFADRYYDSVGFGVFLYNSTNDDLAYRSCLTHSSIMPLPYYSKATLQKADNKFVLYRDKKPLFAREVGDNAEKLVREKIESASSVTAFRRGDILAIELDTEKPLMPEGKRKVRLDGEYCENRTFDIEINL